MTNNGNGQGKWRILREKTLMYSGLTLIGASFVAWLFIRELRYEFVMAGLALCGIGIAQGLDRKDK